MKVQEPIGIGWKVQMLKPWAKKLKDIRTITSIREGKEYHLFSNGVECTIPCTGCIGYDGEEPECQSFNLERPFEVISKTGIGTIKEGRDDINILSMI